MYYDGEVINQKKSAMYYLAAQYRKSPGSIEGDRRPPATIEFLQSRSKQRTSQIKDM